MTAPIALRLLALITLLTAVVDGVSIAHFACNDTWNPSVNCNSKLLVKEICQLHLRLTDLVSDSVNGTTTVPSKVKEEHALLQVIITNGMETLRSTSLHGVDYWIVGSDNIGYTKHDETDIPLSHITITTPNMCGQTYLIVRIIARSGDAVELAIPMQLNCPEKQVDLALVGIVHEDYDVYNHRPVVHPTGQPLTVFITGFQLFVRNALTNTSFSARTGPSTYTVSAYIKSQKFNMYKWSVGNNSQQTVMYEDASQLEYQVGDVMVNEGNRLVPTDGGRRTLALPGGSQTELNMGNMVLNSKEVCGNGIMVVQLKVPHQPSDSNKINNFYLLPVFVDCWGHNPVETIETCQVIPNYYDGGQTAWITYTVPGQTKVYEYKSEERSIRALSPDVDTAALQDIALMKLTTDIQSDRLKELGQCVTSMWGSSDAFVTSFDVLLTSVRKYWDEIEPKGLVQKVEHSKASLILNTFSDMLTLALVPNNPMHNWLHVAFQWYFNPLVPYDSVDSSKLPLNTNQISRRKRDIGGNSLDDNNDGFEVAAQQKSESNNINSLAVNASVPLTTSAASLVKSTTGLPPLTVTLKAFTAGNGTMSGSGSMADSLSKGPLLADGGIGQSSASTVTSSVPSTSRGVGSSSASSSTASSRGATAATLTTIGAGATASTTRGSATSAAGIAAPTRGASSTVHATGYPTSHGASSTSQTGTTGPMSATSHNTIPTGTTMGAARPTSSSTRSAVSSGTTARSAVSSGTTARSAVSSGTTARSAVSSGTTARSAVSSGTTSRSAESSGTTARSAVSSGTTSRSAESSGTTSRSAGSMASTARGAVSSSASATLTTRAGGLSTATSRGVESSVGSITSTMRSAASSSSAASGSVTPTFTSASSGVTTKAAMTTAAGTSATTKGSQPTGTFTTVSTGTATTKASGLTTNVGSTLSDKTTAGGRSSMGQASTASSRMTTSKIADDLKEDEKHFGPKSRWHEQVMEQLYELIKYSGKGSYSISPQRVQAISAFLNTLMYTHKEDFERYSYIPKSTLDGLVAIMKLAMGQNLPRMFDNIPPRIMNAVTDWLNAKYQRHIEVGNSACDFQEGLELALNVTQELMVQKEWQERSDQLTLLAHVFRILLKDDHTQYLSELYTRITAAHKMSRTWMIRDNIPIHEPDEKDICERYTAVKLWQLKTFPVFQFAGRTVSPDQYQSVFWSQERGTIFRGDRSELTNQVFWSKVATCSCPAGSTCGGNVAMAQNGVNPMAGNSPVTGQPMAVAPLHAQIDEGIDLTNDDEDTDRRDGFVGFGLDEAEDMMFGE